MSDDEMDVYDEEMYEEFEDEVEEEDEMLFYPQEPSRMPPGFTKEHTGYDTYQDQCGARSAVNTPYMENFQYQDSSNPHSSGYQQIAKQDHLILYRQIIAFFLNRQVINKSVSTFQVNTWTRTAIFGNKVYRSISERVILQIITTPKTKLPTTFNLSPIVKQL